MTLLSRSRAVEIAEQYHEDGYAIVRGFIPQGEIDRLKEETARIYRAGLEHPRTFRHGNLLFEVLPEEEFGRRYIVQAHWFSWINDWFERFRRREEYLRVLEPLLGRNIRQVAQQIHWKPPGARQTGYRFHQDLRFRNAGAYRNVAASTVNTGLAIDPSTPENGCLRVFPRSHKLGYLGLSDAGDGVLMKGLTQEEELRAAGLDPADMLEVELEPGDLVLWGLLTVHGSLPNESDRDRAFGISSYVRAETSDRGEWAFREGVSTPLGSAPEICKFEDLRERPEPHYVS